MSDVRDLIKKHEGIRLWAYTDSRGIWTTACGVNLERQGAWQALVAAGINPTIVYAAVDAAKKAGRSRTATNVVTQAQVDALLDADIAVCYADLRSLFPDFDSMPENAQAVLVDFRFNVGGATLRTFKNTMAAFQAGNWQAAANGLQNSLWAKQVPTRAAEDIRLLLSI